MLYCVCVCVCGPVLDLWASKVDKSNLVYNSHAEIKSHSRTICSPTFFQSSKGCMCSSPMALTPCLEIFTWLFKLNVLEIKFNILPCSHPQITYLLLYLPGALFIILEKCKWKDIEDIVSIYVCEYYKVEPPYPRTAHSELQSYQAQLKYSWTYFTVL